MSSHKTTTGKIPVSIKKLTFSGLAIALAMLTSNIKIFTMPMGGAITLLSMFFICIIGYWFGLRYGLITAIAYGLLQFAIDPYMLNIWQVLFDYPLAFGALGLSGLFTNKKHGLQIGYITGTLGRLVFSTISGVVFFASYAPKGMNPFVYSVAYQASYIIPEMVITLIIISIPPVTKALNYVKSETI
ncbi:MAG: energy-coupled thiamine transporter ThiT [Lachnospiraceae bacterium]|jgi:thiamine transporter|nr:energy-coupled thiamine transporter ThiT [Lachnospiraceae bacterium]